MKKIIAALVAFVLLLSGASFLVYRQVQAETKDMTIAVTKKAGLQNSEMTESEENAQTTAESEGDAAAPTAGEQQAAEEEKLKTILNVPDTYETNLVSADGNYSIEVAANVSVPDVSVIPTQVVNEKPFDQAWVDTMAEGLFPDGTFYNADSFWEIREKEQQAAEENGTDIETETNHILSEVPELDDLNISDKTDDAKNSEEPETANVAESGESEEQYVDDGYIGYVNTMVKMPDGNWYQWYGETIYGHMDVMVNRFYSPDHSERGVGWQIWLPETSYMLNYLYETEEPGDKYVQRIITEEERQNCTEITQEEAIAMADPYVQAIGLSDFQCTDVEPCYLTNTESTEQEILQGGYTLHYTRNVGEVPLTYTEETGGAVAADEITGEDLSPWGYETLAVTISKDGLESMEIQNLYNTGEVIDANPALLDFAQIKDIFEKNVLNAQLSEGIESGIMHLTDVKLGYTRIYDVQHPTTGKLVPVWDFMGTQEWSEEYSDSLTDSLKCYSHATSVLTVNAIDGSIISRSLGY